MMLNGFLITYQNMIDNQKISGHYLLKFFELRLPSYLDMKYRFYLRQSRKQNPNEIVDAINNALDFFDSVIEKSGINLDSSICRVKTITKIH